MRNLIYCLILILSTSELSAQSIGIGTNTPRPSAQVDISSNNKGLLIPRMTSSERKSINNPDFGLLVFDSDLGTVMFFDGNEWKGMSFKSEDKLPPQIRSSPTSPSFAAFGSRVSISGNYAIIGSHKYTGGSLTSMGEAYIYSKTANGWQLQSRLVAQDSSVSSYFGGAVAIYGDYAVVGSPGKNVGAINNQGKIYVFRRNGNNWVQDTTLLRPAGSPNDNFGWSVGVTVTSSGIPVVTAGFPFADGSSPDRGEVYVYTRNQTTNQWSFSQNIVATDLFTSDNFGTTISMDGDYLAISAPYQDNTSLGRVNTGSVYIYVFGGGVFTQQQKLTGLTSNALFGFSLNLSADKIVVGAPFAVEFNNTSAAVRIYKRSGTNWTLQNTVYLFDFEGGKESILFGVSVAINGNNLLIGAAGGFEYSGGANIYYPDVSGTVYLYKLLSGNNTYNLMQTFKAESPIVTDLFGSAGGLSSSAFIIGAPRNNSGNAAQNGAVLFGGVSQ